MSRPNHQRFLLPPGAVTWIILILLTLSLFPDLPLHFTRASLYLSVLLFIAAIFPYLQRITLRIPGGSVEWEKEIREVARMLQTSRDKTQETGHTTDLQQILFERWCRGFLARWLLFIYHTLHEEGNLDPEKAEILCHLVRQVSQTQAPLTPKPEIRE